MKKILSIMVIGLISLSTFSCRQTPQVVYVQPTQAQPVQQQQTVQGDPNQFFNDPTYANQPPILYPYNGQQMLIDAALMAYFTSYNINPGYYYSTHPGYTHFHVYRNGSYSGYAPGYHGYVTVNHYHYVAPNPKYVTKSGRPDMRYNANKPATTPTKTFNLTRQSPAATPAPAKTFNLSRPSTPSKSFNLSRSSSSSSGHSSSSSHSGRH